MSDKRYIINVQGAIYHEDKFLPKTQLPRMDTTISTKSRGATEEHPVKGMKNVMNFYTKGC